MSKKKTLDEIVTDTPKVETPVDTKPKEMTKREKVKLMHDLTGACENKQLVDIIKNLPNGEKIYDIFVAAVDKEIEIIMNGKVSETFNQEAADVARMVKDVNATLNSFRTVISHFHETPLVKTLESLNMSLGGRQMPVGQYQEQAQTSNQSRMESPADDVRSARSALAF